MNRFILRMKDMTANSEKDLCPSCSYVSERVDRQGTTRVCQHFHFENSGRIAGRVTDCTDYYPKALPSLRQMAEIAWDLSPSKKPGKIGFSIITPADRKKRGVEADVPEFD